MKGKEKGPKGADTGGGIKIICENRKARHNYSIEDRFEAGVALKGTEVKSLRDGKANLLDSYAIFRGSELFLINAHIAPYAMGNRENHEPTRTRKLLLHRAELNKMWGKLETQGFSLIPLKMYFKKGVAKVELGLGKGKKLHDKRDSIKEREVQRQMQRTIRKGR